VSHDYLPQSASVMTPGQIQRRRKLTDTVIELISESGPDAFQMRDVAERSGVALGTAYRYFASKDHLLAAAWADWQRRLTSSVAGGYAGQVDQGSRAAGQGACERVLAFVLRELRGFQRYPNFARLAVYIQASTDPFASEAVVEIAKENERVMRALMAGVPEEIARPAAVAISSTLGSYLVSWITGRMALTDMTRGLEEVTRLVLRDYQARL
jgi:AcrR family transcriptional regulator